MMIVYNPAAGQRRAQRLWRVLDIMAASGLRIEIVETTRPGHAIEIARHAAESGVPLIVAAGGDGTIAEVANGLSDTPCRLGIIPLGTANVLARELGLPFAPRAVAAALAFGRTRTLWPGVAEGAEGSLLFVQMLGAGFDAQVVHHLPLALKRRIGRGAYVAQTLRELTRYDYAPIRIAIDGVETEASSVIVTKGKLYAGAYTLAPGATPTEKGFTVALFDHGGAAATLMYGAALPFNLISKMPGVRLVRAETVDIISNHIPAQADGDSAGAGPLRIRDARSAMNVVVA
ncbi:MAG: YegS/Rv2252/BmrU family lipid kinase [Alphaproteobacteria bacterium]|nr:YegS/Rv2252/BmrU family lipid kinase [Alphaproteobacteria bacterium]